MPVNPPVKCFWAVTAYDPATRGLLDAGGNGERRRGPSNGLLGQDNQLYEALTLLKGINVLGMRDHKPAGQIAESQGES